MNTTPTNAILLAALSAVAAQAHAAADGFNFYGLIDGGIVSTKIKGAGGSSRTEFVTGGYAPTFVGMTGQKFLNSGVKGGFQLEQGFLLNSNPCSAACTNTNSRFWFGPDSVFNRQANVYVEGNFGTVRLGTQPNIAYKSVLLAEPRFGSNYGSALAAIDIDGGLSTGDSGAISYTSPSMSGLTLAISSVTSQRNTVAAPISSGWRASATYKMNDLAATLAYYKNEVTTTPATPDTDGTILGASYKFGAFTLKGLYVSQDAGGVLRNLDTTGIGGAYDVSPELTLDAGVYRSTDTGYRMKTFGFGGQYKIIKDLSLYAQYGNVKNSGTAASSIQFAGPTIAPGTITGGQKATTLNVGALLAFF